MKNFVNYWVEIVCDLDREVKLRKENILNLFIEDERVWVIRFLYNDNIELIIECFGCGIWQFAFVFLDMVLKEDFLHYIH